MRCDNCSFTNAFPRPTAIGRWAYLPGIGLVMARRNVAMPYGSTIKYMQDATWTRRPQDGTLMQSNIHQVGIFQDRHVGGTEGIEVVVVGRLAGD